MKRLILVALCVFMCLPLFAACTSANSEKSTVTTEAGTTSDTTSAPVSTDESDSESLATTTTAPNYGFDDVAKNNWEGYTFKILYSDLLDFEYDFVCEEQLTGNVFNDQIYTRNKMVEDALNIEIYVDTFYKYEWQSIFDSQYSAGWTEGDYNYCGSNGRGSLEYAVKGTIADLATYDDIGLYRDYWEQSYLDQLMINESVYALLGEISLNDQLEIELLLFNKNLFKEYGLEEPYDLVRSYEWTVDKLLDYINCGFVKDIDGNGYELNEDQFGMVGVSYIASTAAMYSSGFRFCKNDGETILFEFDSDQADDAIDNMLSVWGKSGTSLGDLSISPSKLEDPSISLLYDDCFAVGRSLFASMSPSRISKHLTEMEDDYGILPLPMHDEAQKAYYTYVNYAIPMLVVPSTDPNPERTGNIIEALCAASHDYVIPKMFEIVTKIQNARDEDSAEMIEIARTTKIYDAAHWLELDGIATIAPIMAQEKQNIMSSYLNMYQKRAKNNLNSILDGYDKLNK